MNPLTVNTIGNNLWLIYIQAAAPGDSPAPLIIYLFIGLVTFIMTGILLLFGFISLKRQIAERTRHLEIQIQERQRAEEALRANNELFSEFLRHSPIYTYIKDVTPERSLVLNVSDNFHEMVGIPADQMIGKDMRELFPPDFAEKITADDWNVVSKGQVLKVDEQLNGRSYTTIKFPILLGPKTFLAGYTIDITDRLKTLEALSQSEQALRASNNLFSEFMRHSPIYTFIKDVTPERSLVLNVSDNYIEMLGIPAVQMIGKDMGELFPPDFAKKITADDWEVVSKGEVLKLDEELNGRSYATIKFPILQGEKTYLAGYAIDITDRIQTLEALRRSELTLRTVAENFPNSYLFIIEKDLSISFASGRELKKESTQYTGLTLEDIFESQFKQIKKHCQDTFAGLETAFDLDLKGQYFYFRTVPLFAEDGSIPRLLAVVENITSRKQAEIKIQETQVELERLLKIADESRKALLSVVEDQKKAEEQIRKLNAELEKRVRDRTAQLEAANQELEAFAYSVSHDLRAPLRALDGFSAVLLSDYPERLDEQGQNYLLRIQDASHKMSQLINDLLNLSRVTRTELTRQRVDLSAQARMIAQELQSQAPERQVTFEIADHLVAEGDAQLLHQVYENLLSNAFKFTGQRLQGLIQVGEINENNQTVFFVRDNGVGFDMAYANKLFTPFQRLHGANEFPGTGIGLVTVQRIITRHGGRIWVEAAPGQGAAFYFTLNGR